MILVPKEYGSQITIHNYDQFNVCVNQLNRIEKREQQKAIEKITVKHTKVVPAKKKRKPINEVCDLAGRLLCTCIICTG